MLFRKFTVEATDWCGFTSYGVAVFKNGNEWAMFETLIEEDMYDYVSGYLDEEDGDWGGISISHEDISYAEYQEEVRKSRPHTTLPSGAVLHFSY